MKGFEKAKNQRIHKNLTGNATKMAKVVSTNKPTIAQFIYVYVQRSDFSCIFMMITKTITRSVKFLYVMPEIVGKKISMGRDAYNLIISSDKTQ